MASAPVLTLPGAYTLIVESGNTTDPTIRYRNTWDIWESADIPQPSDGIINAIITFTRSNLRTDSTVFMATLRNWSQGPQPFAARPFIWESVINLVGTKATAGPVGYGAQGAGNQSIPGSAVLFCKRLTTGQNKNTALFIRGLLDDADIVSETGGKYVFSGAPNVTPAKFNAIVAASIGPFIGAGLDPGITLVHVGNHKVGPAFRSPVTAVELIGPSQNKMTRKSKR